MEPLRRRAQRSREPCWHCLRPPPPAPPLRGLRLPQTPPARCTCPPPPPLSPNTPGPPAAPGHAPLSAPGDHGPLLPLASSASVPATLTHYLSNIEPGYTTTVPPVREVYNHGWLIGDEQAAVIVDLAHGR